MNTKLESVLKEITKEKGKFSLPLDSYTRINYEKDGRARIFATTIKKAEIPLTLPIASGDSRLNYEQREIFLESLYSARDSAFKQLEWILRFGEYTKYKTLPQKIKNIITFGKTTKKENEIMDTLALTSIGWAILYETSENLALNQTFQYQDFYEEICQISKQTFRKTQQDYQQILSTKGFADPIFNADLEIYKKGILLAVKEKKTKTLIY